MFKAKPCVPINRGSRDPEATREMLLNCAFEEIYQHGYAGASLDRILADSGVTKGALYHHFGSKAELAYAVIEEIIDSFLREDWKVPLEASTDPVTTIREILEGSMSSFSEREVTCGCPLNNLIQELSNEGEGFRSRLNAVLAMWRGAIADAIRRGQRAGTVRADVDADGVGAFVVAVLEGLATTMKSERNLSVATRAGEIMVRFLESLRPDPAALAAG